MLKVILIRIATYQVTPSKALVELNKSEFVTNSAKYKMDKFRKITTHPFYAGILEMNRQVIVRNENGLHEPLTSKQQHFELLKIMANKKKNQTGARKNGNPEFPANNIVSCINCSNKRKGRFVGSNHTNGKYPKIYQKYRCRGCGIYKSKDDMHNEILSLFSDLALDNEAKYDFIDVLDYVWQENKSVRETDTRRLHGRRTLLNEKISSQAIAAIEPDNVTIKSEIMKHIQKMKDEVEAIEKQIETNIQQADFNYRSFISFAFEYIDSLGSKFLELRRRIGLCVNNSYFLVVFGFMKIKKFAHRKLAHFID